MSEDHPGDSREVLLVYCIFKADGHAQAMSPSGVDGKPVQVVECDGLRAVVSKVNLSRYPVTAPKLTHLLAYEKVVETFHRNCCVLPMRYGSILEDELQLIEHLRRRDATYRSLLRKVGGCVEIGVHILLETPAEQRRQSFQEPNSGKQERPSGRAYLEFRQAQYAEEDRAAEADATMIELLRSAFAGLYVRCASGPARIPAGAHAAVRQKRTERRLLSLYFLIKREDEEPFGRALQRIRRRESGKLLMSGPWPPYNFCHACDEGDDEE